MFPSPFPQSIVLPPTAFEWADPAMLGWAAVAAAPILIHLWNRRRRRIMPWAAMDFLRAAVQRSKQRLRLEDALLLAIRMLIPILVAAAAAEPFVRGAVPTATAGRRTHRVLVIDGSYSMTYRADDESRFRRAKEAAAEIIEQSPEGDGFTLVLMGRPPRVVVGTPSLESSGVLREIESLEPVHTGIDLPETLAEIEKLLVEAKQREPHLVRTEIYFPTDLQRAGWSSERWSEAVRREFHERSRRLAAQATFAVLDLGRPDAENLAVTSLTSAEATPAVASPVEFRAVVKNFSARPHRRLPVEWLVDGHRVQRREVDLEPRGEASATFQHRFDASGDHTVEARIEGDRLEADNHRWLVAPVKEAVRVLCIDGRPKREGRERNAASYLAAAMSPGPPSPEQPPLRVEIKSESAVEESQLRNYDCVCAVNVGRFTAAEAEILHAYLKAGGSLVFFLGDQVRAETYNRLIGPAGEAAKILPATIGKIAGPQRRLDPLDYRHPIVRPFQGQERAGLLTTPVHRYYQLSPPADSQARVVLALGNGDPLMIEHTVNGGRVILAAVSPDLDWTALPVWPSFVPLVQETLAYALTPQAQRRNLLVGESLSGMSPTASAGAALTLHSPSGRPETLRLGPGGEWSFNETLRSGLYTIRSGPPSTRRDVYAVNVDTAESDLAMLSPERLREELWPDVPFVHQTTWRNRGEPTGAVIARSSEWPKRLLCAVVVLLLVETYLARRFGQGDAIERRRFEVRRLARGAIGFLGRLRSLVAGKKSSASSRTGEAP